jgi:hypothetical protein
MVGGVLVRWELVVRVPGLQKTHVEDRVNPERLGKLEFVGHWIDHLLHPERADVPWGQLLGHGGRQLKVGGGQSNLVSNLESHITPVLVGLDSLPGLGLVKLGLGML